MDLHDVGVPQPGDGIGLGKEPRPALGVGMGTADQDLERDSPKGVGLLGAVDDTHPTPPDHIVETINGHVKRAAGAHKVEIGEA